MRLTGKREYALIVSVSTDIEQPVRDYLTKLAKFREASKTSEDHSPLVIMPIVKVHQTAPLNNPEEWILFKEKVQRQLRELREAGVERIYVFTHVPVAMALMIGALMKNGPETIVHHFDSRSYQEIGPMSMETTIV
ncbi:MAG: hypothetical protein KatS3mg114_0541 [Planctomycetaceae bacterium]|nr:MAG: hypothetical protein KatS3mg114_0541 [Planctomycetaceae bacterium]